MEFIETSVFTKQLNECLSDKEYTKFQETLIRNPETGPVIKGSGGLRKVRWKVKGVGKSGGIRIIYYWEHSDSQILLLLMYRKNIQETLTNNQLKILKKIVEAF